MKIVIKILFTILLTISVFFYTFQLQIFSMTEQDLFYLLALQRVGGVGDIMAKSFYSLRSAEAVLKPSLPTWRH
jgi:hypothetical protein